MTTCYRKDCEQTPEDPLRLAGPEVGALCVYRQKGSRWDGNVVRVVRRSYVWSPEIHLATGYHGYRHYDWSVVEYEPGHRFVVDDPDLTPLEVGMKVSVVDAP